MSIEGGAGKCPRLFLDSNVLTGIVVARRNLDRTMFSLCAARICLLVLAEVMKKEAEENC